MQSLSLQGIIVSFQKTFKHASFDSLLMARAEDVLGAALRNSLLRTCRSLITSADQIVFTEHLTQVNTAISSTFRLAAVTHRDGQDNNKAGVRKASDSVHGEHCCGGLFITRGFLLWDPGFCYSNRFAPLRSGDEAAKGISPLRS